MKKEILLLIFILFIAFGLRFYKIGLVPPGLYWDEAAMALDAKAVSLTGKDQHGNFWFQAIYPSWGDYKLPGYIIVAVPFFKLIANNPELAVRFSSAFAGTLTVLVIYFLTNEFFKDQISQYLNILISLTASFLLAVSPWHIQFSRAAFEGNLALFFNVLAILFFIKAGRKTKYLILYILASVLSIYTYYSSRIVLPLVILAAFFLFWKNNHKKIFHFLISLVIIVFLCLPLRLSPIYKQAEQFRLSTKNILNNPKILVYSNDLIAQDKNSFLAKKIHHRFLYQAKTLASHYFDHFSLNFLVLNGDSNLRHSTGKIGVLLIVSFIGFCIGQYMLFINNKKLLIFLNICLLISFLPACVPYEVPHSLRSLNAVIFLNIVSAFGIVQLCKLVRNKKLPLITNYLLLITFLVQFLFYLHDYYIHYPSRSFLAWQGGYKDAVKLVDQEYEQASKIIFTTAYARPYLYYLLYSQYPLNIFQAQRQQILKLQRGNYQETQEIDKIKFRIPTEQNKGLNKVLIIGTPNELTVKGVKKINSYFSLWKNY